MQKLKEVFDKAGKTGWELEAWFRLDRSAVSEDNNFAAMLIEDLGQSKVMKSNPAWDTPGFTAVLFKNGHEVEHHTGPDRETAELLFESWI
jgi:hypothetical protein